MSNSDWYPRPQGATPLPEILRHPFTGETVLEVATRLVKAERDYPNYSASARALARSHATRLALSPMAIRDGSSQFYAAVAAHLSEG